MRVHVLDFDGVLNIQSVNKLFTEAVNIVKEMHQQGEILCIATRRSGAETTEMENLLKDAGIYDHFKVIIADSRPKPFHMSKIQDHFGHSTHSTHQNHELVLFDDFDVNINDVRNAGFKAILVDNTFGLQRTHLQLHV